jgi:hypothetical protein
MKTIFSSRAGSGVRMARYDRFPSGDHVDRYVSDFDCHVYYPREVELLFRLTGFSVDARFGDYAMRPLRSVSPQLIVVGLKPS